VNRTYERKRNKILVISWVGTPDTLFIESAVFNDSSLLKKP